MSLLPEISTVPPHHSLSCFSRSRVNKLWLMTKSGPPSVFVNKIIWKHPHPFAYLLSGCYNICATMLSLVVVAETT